ncbi:MAG: divalent-cation tolerance protein CutA [Methylobacter sp.]|nr:MAG: divalent-cation tolerance protein CutA [Methylobacter sp.]PPD04067.1 MAG: divalent-cation tolerance protein CutA [Methylobacter sp.]PPD20145.1 MAG: divalent-cation tolerance protein CutA [Methylobacter sp.]PPD34908.1 MAG: divalent-cation tolerance protein CutA [Methylomonas sp.]
MPVNHQIILCTCPDQCSAETIAHLLIERHLAACVNILPGLTSIYRWQNTVETAQEHLLLIKSNRQGFPAIETLIKENHPYQIPEIIALPIENGSREYLQWIDSCHSPD